MRPVCLNRQERFVASHRFMNFKIRLAESRTDAGQLLGIAVYVENNGAFIYLHRTAPEIIPETGARLPNHSDECKSAP